MELSLAITSIIETTDQGVERRSHARAIMAETDLGPQAAYGSPEFFFGRLIDASGEQIAYFQFAPGVKVGFRGQEYQFEHLDSSGRFKLVRSAQ